MACIPDGWSAVVPVCPLAEPKVPSESQSATTSDAPSTIHSSMELPQSTGPPGTKVFGSYRAQEELRSISPRGTKEYVMSPAVFTQRRTTTADGILWCQQPDEPACPPGEADQDLRQPPQTTKDASPDLLGADEARSQSEPDAAASGAETPTPEDGSRRPNETCRASGHPGKQIEDPTTDAGTPVNPRENGENYKNSSWIQDWMISVGIVAPLVLRDGLITSDYTRPSTTESARRTEPATPRPPQPL